MNVVCSVCYRALDGSQSHPVHLSSNVRKLLRSNLPRWSEQEHICSECVEHFQHARSRLRLYFQDDQSLKSLKILPTPLRLGASPLYTGRQVTIAFLDSGFFNHPDLIFPLNRIIKYVNIVTGSEDFKELNNPEVSSWHGMMTSVVAAGNGYLSKGLYRGIASEAKLVLVKVGSSSRIQHDDIKKGIDWVLRYKEDYGIQIVNISCGGDYERSYLIDDLSQSAEIAVKEGLVVVTAVGNAGNNSQHPVLPPASAPSIIAVGGLDDKNSLNAEQYSMYHSSYGPTIDGLQKPEIIAPGIWVAAPILPGTPTADQAVLLNSLQSAPDIELSKIIQENPGIDEDLDASLYLAPYLIRHLTEIKIRDNNVISDHYKHVDGTSFAAPIVSSVVAQMLEANPNLNPQQVKKILISTAERLPNINPDRQGWGVINPRLAVASAIELRLKTESSNSTAS